MEKLILITYLALAKSFPVVSSFKGAVTVRGVFMKWQLDGGNVELSELNCCQKDSH